MNTPLYCPLPLTDKRRAYVSADATNVAETWRQFETIRVSALPDDYDRTTMDDWLSAPGGFRT